MTVHAKTCINGGRTRTHCNAIKNKRKKTQVRSPAFVFTPWSARVFACAYLNDVRTAFVSNAVVTSVFEGGRVNRFDDRRI